MSVGWKQGGARGRSVPQGISAVDLFCGAGGLTHGLRALGIDVRAGYDIDGACRFAYETNNRPATFYERDVRSVTPADVSGHFVENTLRALVGCAPCTPFSALRRSKDTSDEDEWHLLGEFGRLVKGVNPDLVSMENVPQIVKHDVFAQFEKLLESLGYNIDSTLVQCERYGVPQKRRRLVLLASKLGPISLVKPTHARPRTVKGAIGALPEIAAGGVADRDPTHRSARLSNLNLRRVRASVPGGTWRDWKLKDRLACHKRESGATYEAVYGRMEWNKPSPPITTKFYNLGSGRFGHPKQDRAISLREGALLQTFPAEYAFVAPGEKVRVTKLGMLIGNAVPPRLGEVVGASLQAHVTDIWPDMPIPRLPEAWRKHLSKSRGASK